MNELKAVIAQSPLGPIDLPTSIRSIPAYFKFESTNPMISDTQHGDEWREQFSSFDKWNVGEDDGCIFTFCGRPQRMVGITNAGEVLSEEEVDMRLTANPNAPIPIFRQYSFFLESLVKTDGPQQRENLRRSVEQQRAAAEKELTGSIASAFAQLAQILSANQNGGVQDALKALIPPAPELHPAQVEAQRILKEMEAEDLARAQAEPVEADEPEIIAAELEEEGELEPAPDESPETVQSIVDNLIAKNRRNKVAI